MFYSGMLPHCYGITSNINCRWLVYVLSRCVAAHCYGINIVEGLVYVLFRHVASLLWYNQ